MAVMDAHTHAFPDEIAERAIASLESAAEWKAVGKGTTADLLASMDAADVDVSFVCAIATKPDQVKGIHKWCKKIHSDRLEPFPSVHPETPKAAGWIEKFAEDFAGIKLHPMYQDFAVDEPRMDAIYSAAAECGIFVTIHCGRDIAFGDDDRASPQRFRRVIDRHPNLRLLCTHLGGWRNWDEAEKYLIGMPVYLETSFCLDYLQGDQAAAMIVRHGTQRVLFGTDWPWKNQGQEAHRIRSLGLGKEATNAILFRNAAGLLGY